MSQSTHVIDHLRNRARKIAACHASPDFYKVFSDEVTKSAEIFQADDAVQRLYGFVKKTLDNDFGHGLDHAWKVALDAGTLVAIEERSSDFVPQRIRLAHCAGLLHDIKRKQTDHARKGAIYAREVLAEYPFSETEVSDICTAIANHEAFKSPIEVQTVSGRLLCGCLYDADKFRFGPDNFTHTVWDMVEASNISIDQFFGLYPKGMHFLRKIKHTFQTPTGRKYGPQFIDIGLAIGEALYAYMTENLDLSV